MPKKQEDVAARVQVLRPRIYHLEQKLAAAYPDEREALEAEIGELIAEYESLVPAIKEEAERRKAELLRGWEALNRDRQDLLRLLGHRVGAGEPVRRNMRMEVVQSSDPREPFLFAQTLGLAPLEHYPR